MCKKKKCMHIFFFIIYISHKFVKFLHIWSYGSCFQHVPVETNDTRSPVPQMEAVNLSAWPGAGQDSSLFQGCDSRPGDVQAPGLLPLTWSSRCVRAPSLPEGWVEAVPSGAEALSSRTGDSDIVPRLPLLKIIPDCLDPLYFSKPGLSSLSILKPLRALGWVPLYLIPQEPISTPPEDNIPNWRSEYEWEWGSLLILPENTV